MIGTSTPSFIQPINRIVYKENSIELDTNENSKYVHYLNSMISNIMTGPDTNKWITKMEWYGSKVNPYLFENQLYMINKFNLNLIQA